MQFVGFGPTLQRKVFEHGASHPHAAARRGSDVIHRLHCLRSNSCKRQGGLLLELSLTAGEETAAEYRSPGHRDHPNDVPTPPSPARLAVLPTGEKSRLPAFFICFHAGLGSMTQKAVGYGAAAAQRDSQIMNRIGRKVHAGAVALFQHAFHPKREACFLRCGSCCGDDWSSGHAWLAVTGRSFSS